MVQRLDWQTRLPFFFVISCGQSIDRFYITLFEGLLQPHQQLCSPCPRWVQCLIHKIWKQKKRNVDYDRLLGLTDGAKPKEIQFTFTLDKEKKNSFSWHLAGLKLVTLCQVLLEGEDSCTSQVSEHNQHKRLMNSLNGSGKHIIPQQGCILISLYLY